jgi:hypothetical protein
MGREFTARDMSSGPTPFDLQEEHRIEDASLIQLGGFSAAATTMKRDA